LRPRFGLTFPPTAEVLVASAHNILMPSALIFLAALSSAFLNCAGTLTDAALPLFIPQFRYATLGTLSDFPASKLKYASLRKQVYQDYQQVVNWLGVAFYLLF
jgi:hypothetical protein